MSMNYDILKFGISQSAKIVWHVLRDGVVSMMGIREATGLKRRQATTVVSELLRSGLIIRVGYGCYKVRETALGERETALEVREIALEARKTALDSNESAENRALLSCSNRAKNRAGRAKNCAGRAKNCAGREKRQTAAVICVETDRRVLIPVCGLTGLCALWFTSG